MTRIRTNTIVVIEINWAIRIDSVNISESTISDGSYPIQRPFIQIYNNILK